MENTDIAYALTTLQISPIELLFITILSLIGGSIHEYIVNTKGNKKESKTKIAMNLLMSTVISNIICITINPYIMRYLSIRLILLPPLILGLIGPELVVYMIGVKSTGKIFEYVLSFVGITRHGSQSEIPIIGEIDDKPPPQSGKDIVENELKSIETLDHDEIIIHTLDINSEYLLNKLNKLLNQYINDSKNIQHDYSSIINEIEELKKMTISVEFVPTNIAIRIAEVLRISKEIEKIWRSEN